MLSYILVGFFAGLHRASWGAYKDSPFEDFRTHAFIRSLFFGSVWAGVLYYLLPFLGIERSSYQLLHVYAIALSFDTITLEIYKLFFRTEGQEKYQIPSRFNILGKEVSDQWRYLIGIASFAGVGLLFGILAQFNVSFDALWKIIIGGFVAGFLFGILEACGGSWKDAPFEGFEPLKFFRSPLIGGIWGIIFAFGQSNLGVLVFSVSGAVRMTVEVHKAFLKGYRSGKFKAQKPTFTKWTLLRKYFYPSYILTWVVFIGLLVASFL